MLNGESYGSLTAEQLSIILEIDYIDNDDN